MDAITVITKLDAYAFAFLVLLIIAFLTIRSQSGKTIQTRLYLASIVANIFLIATDAVSIILGGTDGTAVRVIVYSCNILYYCLQTSTCLFWFLYATVIVEKRNAIPKKELMLTGLPIAVSMLTVASTPWTGWCFLLDEHNVFMREPLSYLILAIGYAYVVGSYVLIIKQWNKIERKQAIALLSFAVLPAVCGIAQLFVYGVNLILPSMTIANLLVFLTIQHEELMIDHLTGLNNRRCLDRTLERKVTGAKGSSPFAVMITDLDGFKNINDTYGHIEGDHALEATARVLRHCFHHQDFIARYGGDEFVVIFDIKEPDNIDAVKTRLLKQIDSWNETSGMPWKISLSTGCAPYSLQDKLSPAAYLAKIDSLLYEDKALRKTSGTAALKS